MCLAHDHISVRIKTLGNLIPDLQGNVLFGLPPYLKGILATQFLLTSQQPKDKVKPCTEFFEFLNIQAF